MKILAIGAHPDDIELGCGGTLLRATKEGHAVYMLTMTKGAASGNPLQRANEMMQASKFIGAKDFRIDDLPDTRLASNIDELIRHIEDYVDEVDPDLIFTHSRRDTHHDHRAVAAATSEAARFYSNVLTYEIPLTKDFDPIVYYDISDVIEKKIELIRIFWSQSSKLYLQSNAIRSLSEYRALQGRLNTTMSHVEAFEAMRLFLDADFRLLKAPFSKPEARSIQNYSPEIAQRA
ncbi:MAG: PIG-L family deacetylase [Thaumarchaeota archaeon]|nr:PIG-L family deacetylase [Nitrososphaerota archaeon]